MGRLILVSNRLPVTIGVDRGQLLVTRSSGGLASALRSAHEDGESLWIGWPGELPVLSASQRRQFDWQMTSHRVVPIELSPEEVSGYYEELSNAVLWPVAHGLLDMLPLEMHGWETYRAVNERFAAAVADLYQDGDTIWVHDYHLMLLPALLRDRLPHARIGYFHHIPFPAPDIFSVLPWRDELIRGVLGAELAGFQTAAHAAAFLAATRLVTGVRSGDGCAVLDGRRTRVAHFPISVDARAWAELAETPEARSERERYRDGLGGTRLIVGVDRLDYTKGLMRRLLAFERLLERAPEFRESVRFVQVTVPSRESVDAYASLKQRVDEVVGRINGRFGTPHSMPVHRMHGYLSPHALAGLYRAADVMVVTPLRDGMNLVAKEFVAARADEDGTLVLSEFAGAADELTSALIVNPYSVEAVALAIQRALEMPESERRMRMAAMRARVVQRDLSRWLTDFLAALALAQSEDVDRLNPARRPRGRALAILS